MAKLSREEQNKRLNKAKKIARSRGGELLSNSYQGVDAKYIWRCSKGHEWKASYYSVVQRGSWCGLCCGTQRLSIDQLLRAQEIAERKGGLCLSEKYENSQKKLNWKCQYGHEWEASFANISKGKWCPWCGGNKVDPLQQFSKAQEVAKSHGGNLLSTSYMGNKAPLKWRCAEGHEWEASFSTVVGRKNWCGRCRGTQRLSAEQFYKAQEIAESKGGKCISQTYINNSESMEW